MDVTQEHSRFLEYIGFLVEVRKYFATLELFGKWSRGKACVKFVSRLGFCAERFLVEHVNRISLRSSFIRNGSERLMSASSGIVAVDWGIWNCPSGSLSRCMIGHKCRCYLLMLS